MTCLSMTIVTLSLISVCYCCHEQINSRFVSQGRVRTAIRRGGQFACSFCFKFTSVSVCQRLPIYNVVWQSYCKNKRVQFFFAPQNSGLKYLKSRKFRIFGRNLPHIGFFDKIWQESESQVHALGPSHHVTAPKNAKVANFGINLPQRGISP